LRRRISPSIVASVAGSCVIRCTAECVDDRAAECFRRNRRIRCNQWSDLAGRRFDRQPWRCMLTGAWRARAGGGTTGAGMSGSRFQPPRPPGKRRAK
jgi:hypothetical protein